MDVSSNLREPIQYWHCFFFFITASVFKVLSIRIIASKIQFPKVKKKYLMRPTKKSYRQLHRIQQTSIIQKLFEIEFLPYSVVHPGGKKVIHSQTRSFSSICYKKILGYIKKILWFAITGWCEVNNIIIISIPI